MDTQNYKTFTLDLSGYNISILCHIEVNKSLKKNWVVLNGLMTPFVLIYTSRIVTVLTAGF